MVLCAGLIVPSAYLPEAAQLVGEIAPLYSWSLLGQELLYGDVGFAVLLIPLCWMLGEFAIGVYVSWKKA
jgi:hypothetical protein